MKSKKDTDYETVSIPVTSVYRFISLIENMIHMIRFCPRNIIHILTKQISSVFDTSIVDVTDTFTQVNHRNKISKISFLKEMAHKQVSGSFNPTEEDWFQGVKW
jgi:hypothetical protein